MNKLWNLQNYSAEALHRTVVRDGLRIRIHPQVHPFLRREVHTFVRWLRANYPFPIRVNVYIPNTKKIRANDGDLCYGRCFVPDDPDDSITIDVAGGYDYDGDFRTLQNYTWGTIFEPVFISDEAAQRHLQCGSLLPQLKLKFQTPLRDGEQHSSSQRCVRQSSATEVFPTHEA